MGKDTSRELFLALKRIINLPDNVIRLTLTLGVNELPIIEVTVPITNKTNAAQNLLGSFLDDDIEVTTLSSTSKEYVKRVGD